MGQERQINVRLTDKDIEQLSELVSEGYFGSISDAVRTAVRYLLRDFRYKPCKEGDAE